MNGQTPADGWTGLFRKGEKVRLRFINGSAMSFFDVRIPGLKMTVVAADGQYVQPVSVDEFRIGVAETYDVIVEPDDGAYTIFAQSIDRSGYARGTLTPDVGMKAAVPPMDPVPNLTHTDMGMDMSAMGHNMPGMGGMDMKGMDHSKMAMGGMDMKGMDHSKMNMGGGNTPVHPSDFSSGKVIHAPAEYGPQVDMRAAAPRYRLDDPGVGLRNNGRRVLTYADLRNLHGTNDPREPDREIPLHLTGNMERYMWSMNGVKFNDAEPLRWKIGERLRITFVNDTMMNHPMHLHGMWSDLETGDNDFIPRKHTVIVQPGSRISYRVTVDAEGGWAYHCHLLYHMLGMFREVQVS
jgi:CopA family copper-resistance protein